MLKVVLSHILLIMVTISTAQEGFELTVNTDMRSDISGCIKDNAGNNLFTGYQFNPPQQLAYLDGIVLKVNNSGDTIFRVIHKEDTSCYIRKSIVLNDNSYMVFGGIGVPESNYKKLNYVWVQKLDENLNTIWDKRIKLKTEYWNPFFEVAMTNDSSIYLAGYAQLYGSPSYQYLFAMKFNVEGDTLKSLYYTGPSSIPIWTYGILSKPNDNGIITFGTGFDYNMTEMQALELDSNLTLTITGLTEPIFTGLDNVTAKWFSPNSALLSCRAMGQNGDNDVELIRMNENFQLYDQHWYGRVDTSDYPAWRTSMDFTNKNEIWVTGQLEHFPIEPINSYILVYLVDSTLNLKGMKYYGGDMNYSALTTTATSDGGCILGCTVYDWKNSTTYDTDLWIKKIFPEDVVTNAEDTPDPYDRDVLVFPNPFTDKIIIKTIRKDLTLSLFTIDGKKIIEEKIENNLNHILNTSYLEKGTYVYKILYNNKIIQTDKLIKF